MTIVVVSGIPGSGKTTLAHSLSPALGIPLVSKDDIKESLFDALGTGDLVWSQRLSRAAHLVMYDLAATMPGDVMIEAHFYRGVAEPELVALGRPLVQVWCRCPVDVAWDRYRLRRDDPDRHAGHRTDHQDDDATRHWREAEPLPLGLDAPLIEVDTDGPGDLDQITALVRAALVRSGDSPR